VPSLPSQAEPGTEQILFLSSAAKQSLFLPEIASSLEPVLSEAQRSRRAPRNDSHSLTSCHCPLGEREPESGLFIKIIWTEYSPSLTVNFRAALLKLFRFLAHAGVERGVLVHLLLHGIVAHVLGDLHRAEVWTTHRAEMRDFRPFGG
jgi:hypothetical protein